MFKKKLIRNIRGIALLITILIVFFILQLYRVNNKITKAELIVPLSTETETNISKVENIQLMKKARRNQDVNSNRWDIELSDEEIDLLAKIVFLEANLEPLRGQEAVVEIVFNRMCDKYFHGDLEHVLSAKGQFVTWKLRDVATPTRKNYKAIKNVLEGKTNIFGKDYLYFSVGGHANHKSMKKIKGHQFCTE